MIYPPATFEQKTGFDSVRALIAAMCGSELGRRRCTDMAFTSDYATVLRMLEEVDEMCRVLSGDDAFPVENIHDCDGPLRSLRPQGTFLTADELHRVRQSLGTMTAIARFIARNRNDDEMHSPIYPRLAAVAERLTEFPALTAAIDRVIDPHGGIKDNASPELADLRRRMASLGASMSSIIRRVISSAVKDGFVDSDTTATMRDGRLVIPVAPMHKRKIPGIVHDESASGKTVFIEPTAVVEANNRLRELQIEEQREIVRILTAVADMMRPELDNLLAGFDVLGDFDFINAKARWALQVGGAMPVLHDTPHVEWHNARHPMLQLTLEAQGKQIVPLNIRLSVDEHILVISGPNAGGKSVTLKTAGIIQYMAQCGVLPTMQSHSHMGVMESIFIDIGDDQSIEDDLSTYSSHLRNMKFFLSHGNDRTLILIDEFGAGTEPQIGGAIAQAILEQFCNARVMGVITTHFQNLKKYAEETSGLINGSMLYDRNRMQPLYSLAIGHPGSSFAVEIARKTGLPEAIVAKAEEIVGSDYINLDKYLLDIARDRRYWENKRSEIRRKEKRLDEITERYADEAETLRRSRREILDEARRQAANIVDSSNAAIERTIHDIRRAQADRDATIEARRRLADERRAIVAVGGDDTATKAGAILDRAPKKRKAKDHTVEKTTDDKPFATGDAVLLDGTGTPGTVSELRGKEAVVIFGQIKTTVRIDRLRHTMKKVPSGADASRKSSFVSSATVDDIRQRQLQFKTEIDVRGMRAAEAVQAVTYFIDDAIQFSSERVRILHGTGTGALRQYIRQYLNTVTAVRSYHDEDVRFGGAGITVVEF